MEHNIEPLMHITARYVEEFQAGKSPSLADYLQRYPQYQSEILDFVAYYHAFESPLPPPASTMSLSNVSRTALDLAYMRIDTDAAPLHSLLLSRQQVRLHAQQLADALDLSPTIIHLLESRVLDPTSIPHTLILRLARVLDCSVAQVEAFLAGESVSTSVYHSTRKVAEQSYAYSPSPSARQTFTQALLASSDLSPQQRQMWLACLTQEDDTPTD